MSLFPVGPIQAASDGAVQLQPLGFSDLPGFAEDDHLASFEVFLRSCTAIQKDRPPLRLGLKPSGRMKEICSSAINQVISDKAAARRFFEGNFQPFLIRQSSGALNDGKGEPPTGFLTGYYEPIVEGSLVETPEFKAPLLARPKDLISLQPGQRKPGLDPILSAAKLLADGSYAPYPDRGAIEQGALGDLTKPIIWLRDRVEVFLIQVQGSARARLPDGRLLRVAYAGRNGQPYTSIGRILVEQGEIALEEMGLARLKSWIRAHGQSDGEAGAALMLRNKSYIFFAIEEGLAPDQGPIGGAGIPLSPFRSIAVDRTIWSYGLPFWISADLPWQGASPSPFRHLLVAQDTGSAIIGPARVDIFFGSGETAGERAGSIRHHGDVVVFLPRGEARDDGLEQR